MKICIASDLHCEIGGYPGQTKHLKDGGDLLILAGDITCARYFDPDFVANPTYYIEPRKGRKVFEQLMKNWCSRFNRVFYIMGNHEHYGYVLDKSANTMREYLNGTNVTVMDDTTIEYKDVVFHGSTMWTDYKNGDVNEMSVIRYFMNDYRQIKYMSEEDITYVQRQNPDQNIREGKISPYHLYQKHLATRKFLEEAVTKYKDKKNVVITHHAPTLKCQNNARHGMELAYAYISDMDSFIEDNPQIALWVSAHTHDCHDFMIGKTRLISNQRGYAGHERIADNFKPIFVEV